MKKYIFILSMLLTVNVFAAPTVAIGIHQALKNPSSVTTLTLSGEKDEAALLTKNAKSFISLNQVVISNLSDSVAVEQNILSVAACTNVRQLKFENCGIRNFSGALKMLVSVKEVEISNCKKLSSNSAFSTLAEMPSLRKMNFQTDRLTEIPRSFFRLRTLDRIIIQNKDISLADGYALNTTSLQSLFVHDSLMLGFGANKLMLEYSCYDKFSGKSHISLMRDMLQGAVGVNGKMVLPQRAVAFNRINALIHPPISGLNVYKSIYTTDATFGGEIDHPSGTQIYIPEKAFVDASGNEIKGNVTIDYREFRDQVDIMLSGIPMDYDSGGVKGHFVSAGMFEMNASVNGEEVFLANGKNVEMKFAVVDTADNFNFYKLDEKKGWLFENSPGKVEKENIAPKVAGEELFSPALWSYYQWKQAATIRRNNPVDTTKREVSREIKNDDTLDFATRYADTGYVYTFKNYSGQYYYEDGRKSIGRDGIYIARAYRSHGTTCFRIVRGDGYNNDPELNAFGSAYWKTTQKLRTPELLSLFHHNSGVNDMRIYKNDSAGFTLEFKTAGGYRRIDAVPVWLIGKTKSVECSQNEQNNMFKKYEKDLSKREQAFNKNLKPAVRTEVITYQNHYRVADYNLDSVSFWKKLKPRMDMSEKQLDFQGWDKYYLSRFPKMVEIEKKRIEEERKRILSQHTYGNIQVTEGSKGAGGAQAQLLYQALTLTTFGVYNCDCCPPMENPIVTNAQFDVEGIAASNVSNVYVIDKTVNTTTNYFNRGGSDVSIKYTPQNPNTLIIIDSEGRLFFTDQNAFAKGNQSGANTRYSAVMITDKPATPEQLKKLISGDQK